MTDFENVPETYTADNEEFDALYVLTMALLLKVLMKFVYLPVNLPSAQLLVYERNIKSEIRAIFSQLERKSIQMATNKVTEAYTEGVNYAITSLSQEDKLVTAKGDNPKAGSNKPGRITANQLNDSHKRKMKKLVDQTQSDLLKATHNTENNVKLLVRKIVSREIAEAGKSGRMGKKKHMADRIERQLRQTLIESGYKDADVAIIDRAGRKWKLETYSSMVTRTKMNMAYIEAIREESLQDGTDLAIISTKPDTHDACLNYEGMIISLNGLTPGYLTYEGIKKTKLCFHPNCGHFVRPISSIDRVPKKLMDTHNKQMKKYQKDKDSLKQQTSRDSIN